jgi:hypothetical protein
MFRNDQDAMPAPPGPLLRLRIDPCRLMAAEVAA